MNNNDDSETTNVDLVADGKKTLIPPKKISWFGRLDRFMIVDTVVVEHRDKYGNLIKKHTCNSGLWHKFLVKIGQAHNSINAQGIADAAAFLSGVTTAPTGTCYVANASTAVTGVGSNFSSFAAYDWIIIAGYVCPIASITNNTSLTLTTGYGGATIAVGVAVPYTIVRQKLPYIYIGIGTETSVDTQTDTSVSNTAFVLLRPVIPTISNNTFTGDIITWTHVFSQANDASLTGTTAVKEVGITTAAASYRILVHISGTNYAASADSCVWDNGDTLTITITCKSEQGA